MSLDQVWVGIDVSKSWFDVCVPGERAATEAKFKNEGSGFARLFELLKPGMRVCLEATGGHERALCAFLIERGFPVCRANPSQVRSFGEGLGLAHKTDRLDARLLAEYGRLRNPAPTSLEEASRHELRQLALAWKDLQRQRLQAESRLKSPLLPESARRGLESARAGLDTAMADVLDAMGRLLETEADLAADVRLLESIPGIARTSALQILAHLPVGELRSARALASYAGLAPCHRESGSSVRGRTRIGFRCNRRLRTALYMCALVARRFCPHIKAFADRLVERGKAKMQAIAAVMRKLAHAIFAVLSRKEAYNGAKLCRNA